MTGIRLRTQYRRPPNCPDHAAPFERSMMFDGSGTRDIPGTPAADRMPDRTDTFITHWGVAIHPWPTVIDMATTVTMVAGGIAIATAPLFRVAYAAHPNIDTNLERRISRLEMALEYNLVAAVPQVDGIYVGEGYSFRASLDGEIPTHDTMALVFGGRQVAVDRDY